MRKDNILILSVSRKTLLCRWFLKAARKFGLGVLGADINPKAQALSLLDGAISLPCLSNPSFINELLLQIRNNQIKLVVPTREDELLFLPNFIKSIGNEGCLVLCNPPDITNKFIDKAEFTRFCNDELGFKNLRMVKSPGEARNEDFPLFFRGNRIRSSLKIKIRNQEELRAAFILFEEGIATTIFGGKEISIDCYVSREGKIIYNVPRTRDIVLGGESIVTTTIECSICTETAKQFLIKSGIKGPAVLQGIFNGRDFVPFEINLRFGGASVLSFKAAYSGPELALREYVMGEGLTEVFQYQPHLELFKDFKEIYTRS
ncbi:MAG: ATP-grasp domain-containing protein [Thermoplasmata archaeon]|nr:MAG: ATP-grasp domain-containing protein [Thermoplasmata archaeon]